jgi:hypothetical protein
MAKEIRTSCKAYPKNWVLRDSEYADIKGAIHHKIQ